MINLLNLKKLLIIYYEVLCKYILITKYCTYIIVCGEHQAMVADSQNQQCGIIFLAYSLARKLAIRVETRPNQVTIL